MELATALNVRSQEVVKPGGSHSTRIENLPENQKKQVKQTLEDWLEISILIK